MVSIPLYFMYDLIHTIQLVRVILLLDSSKEIYFLSGRPSVQFFTMMEALRNLLGLRAWMDFALVRRERFLPPTQYVSELLPPPTRGVIFVPVDISTLKEK